MTDSFYFFYTTSISAKNSADSSQSWLGYNELKWKNSQQKFFLADYGLSGTIKYIPYKKGLILL